MDLDLKVTTITPKMKSVVMCLNNEPQIQRQLMTIESKCGTFISDFRRVLGKQGKNLFRQKEKLFSTRSIKTLAIAKPLQSLREIGSATKEFKGQIAVVEIEVANTIEDCRSRIMAKKNELLLKRCEIDKIKGMISLFKHEQRTLERDAEILLLNAKQKEEEAKRLQDRAKDNRLIGAGAGLVGGVTAFAFSPFTAGGCLLAFAAGGATLGASVSNASVLFEKAEIENSLAVQKKNESQCLSLKIKHREVDCKTKDQEVRDIEIEISGLINEQSKLSDVSNLLSKFVDSIMRLQLVFQSAEVTFRDTYQHTKVLGVFDKEDAMEPEMLDMANSLLDKTKERWIEMENELVQQGFAQRTGSRLVFVTNEEDKTSLVIYSFFVLICGLILGYFLV